MKNLIILIIVIFSFTSCEKMFFDTDKASNDPNINFDYLWNEVNKKYSYFELKNIDWDDVRTTYRDKISSKMSEEELFDVLGGMLKELKDDHTNLFSPFDISKYNVALHSKANYNQRTIDELFPDIHRTGSFRHALIENKNVAYIRYSSFMSEITDDDLDYILKKYRASNGIILDLRANGGGNIFFVPKILERFVSQKTLVGYFKTRNGEGRNDFAEPQNFYLSKHDGITYNKPVVVLIDRGSYSATTMFALASKAISNITLIGDSTGGGGGAPNGGQLPNGWTYRFSTSQMLDLDMKNYAEHGVPADIFVDFNWSDLSKDEILDRALEELE